MLNKRLLRTFSYLLIGLFVLSSSLYAADNPSTYEIFQRLRESALTHDAMPVRVLRGSEEVNWGLVTYGAEKEGSSARLVRVAGPNAESFLDAVRSSDEMSQERFLRSFFGEMLSSQKPEVQDIEGRYIRAAIDFTSLEQISNASTSDLMHSFERWLAQTSDAPYSFMKLNLRRKLFYGELAGMENIITKLNDFNRGQWGALLGEPQTSILGVQAQNTIQNGWEINFKPQKSYGEFERMVIWFRQVMGSSSELFQSPGHHRLVFPRPEFESPMQKIAFNQGMAEMYKTTQAYAVLRGIRGKTGINMGQWKFMMSDVQMAALNRRANEIFRLEQDYIAPGTMSFEMRAGTKDPEVQRFIQQVVTARVANQDFSDLASHRSWELLAHQNVVGGYPNDSPNPEFPQHQIYNLERTSERFDISQDTVRKAFDNLSSIERRPQFGTVKRVFLLPEFWAPLWSWENAPFIGDGKKDLLKNLTRNFLENIASLENPTERQVQEILSDWVKISNIDKDIENYLRPKPVENLTNGFRPHDFNLRVSNAQRSARAVDINRVDLGLEYTGRFPIQNDLLFTDSILEDGKYHWLSTAYDLENTERRKVLLEVAQTLSEELGADVSLIKEVPDVSGHGHGLGIAYEVFDSKNRKWKVEWDGIGRTYNRLGNVIQDSQRGGHIEIVTPKFQPDYNEIQAVYRTFERTNTFSNFAMGGAHINVDLAVFDGRPRELARFLTLFHEYRDIMALMYQHPKRLLAAEAIDVSDRLAHGLADFNGSESDLKKLLYNEQYFNNRVGRKTRYVQLDLSAYFQDIIPAQYIHPDFDIGNPSTPWRQQFRVDPKIRKMEFRLFGAPETSREAALQIRLVRALLDRALNSDDKLLGKVSDVNLESFRAEPQKAIQRLQRMTSELGLDFDEYRPAMARGLEKLDSYMNSIHYRSFSERTAIYPQYPRWEPAIEKARPQSKSLSSNKRTWNRKVVPEAKYLMKLKKQARDEVNRLRKKPRLVRKDVKLARTDARCQDIVNFLLHLN